MPNFVRLTRKRQTEESEEVLVNLSKATCIAPSPRGGTLIRFAPGEEGELEVQESFEWVCALVAKNSQMTGRGSGSTTPGA